MFSKMVHRIEGYFGNPLGRGVLGLHHFEDSLKGSSHQYLLQRRGSLHLSKKKPEGGGIKKRKPFLS